MKKKIMFLESRSESFYGAQKSMLKLIQSLDKNHFDYKVVTTEEGKLKNGLEENSVPVDIVKLGKKANVFGGKALKYSLIGKLIVAFQIVLYNFKIAFYILGNKVDVVYANDLRALLYSVLATKILRKKNVLYIRSDVTDSKLTEIGFIFSDNIITIAHGVLRDLPQSKIEKICHKIINIYTGFDFNQYKIFDNVESKKGLDISENKFVIGYLGSINERKGIDILVDAFIEINKDFDNTQLLIVGDVSSGHESYWDTQLQKIEERSIPFKHIPFCDEVSRAYSAMDIFVLPSRSEGLPRVVIEAMGHQLPVIATDVGGTKEIIEDDSLGIIINKEDRESLNQAIKKVLENKEYREKIAQQGQEFVKSRFGEERFAKKVNSFFKTNKLFY